MRNILKNNILYGKLLQWLFYKYHPMIIIEQHFYVFPMKPFRFKQLSLGLFKTIILLENSLEEGIIIKPTIYYSRTWRIGDKIIFSLNKILLAKTRRTWFAVNFRSTNDFFSTNKYFVFVNETATPMQILRTVYGKKPVRETWWTPFIHYSPYVVLPLFRCCSRVVYSRLNCQWPRYSLLEKTSCHCPVVLWFHQLALHCIWRTTTGIFKFIWLLRKKWWTFPLV